MLSANTGVFTIMTSSLALIYIVRELHRFTKLRCALVGDSDEWKTFLSSGLNYQEEVDSRLSL